MNRDILAQSLIEGLAKSAQRGDRALASIPGLMHRLIDENLWQRRTDDGKLVRFKKDEFRAFVEAPYPIGLSTTMLTLEALCAHDSKVMEFIEQAQQVENGFIELPLDDINATANILAEWLEPEQLDSLLRYLALED